MKPEDRAQEIELAEWEERQRGAILPQPTQESARYCRDLSCGDEIPEQRRLAIPGVQFCAECQARREWKERIRGRHAGTD